MEVYISFMTQMGYWTIFRKLSDNLNVAFSV